MTTASVALLLFAWLAVPSAGQPPADPSTGQPDPAAHHRKLKRGGAEETSAFDKHQLRSERKRREGRRKGEKGGGPAARASRRHAPQPKAEESPEVFVEYDLAADAEVSVSIVGQDGAPLRQFTVPPGIAGSLKGANRLAWDGRDSAGTEVPPGEYMALLTIFAQQDGQAAPQQTTKMVPVRIPRKAP